MSSGKFEVPQLGNRALKTKKDYVRVYMACERCRNVKAKCEISGSSAACVRCVRERRDCVFAPERSTKRRKPNSEGVEEATSHANDSAKTQDPNSASLQQKAPKTKASHEPLIDTVVYSSNDALGILFDAAEQNDSDGSDRNVDASVARTYDDSTSPSDPLRVDFPSPLSKPARRIVKLWQQYRFVRQGWFTAVEAVTYIDLFFKNLSSLSPITSHFYASHRNHQDLLEEPLLCCTLLMVSSRYHVLPGPGGTSRADFIHMQLWKQCEHLIQRLTFGQERSLSTTSRTLGSIKALLLMTEWHPRSLHFPPENDGWDSSVAPAADGRHDNTDSVSSDDDHSSRLREEVFEPAKRSDRMSWMLLGLATTLAHELGVFTDPDPDPETQDPKLHPHNRLRTRRLLFLYVNQLSLRLNCTSSLPQSISMSLDPPPSELNDAITKDRDMLISKWIDITRLRKTTTEMFFSSKPATRQVMSSGRYVALLDHFQPLLAQWKRDLDSLKLTTLPPVSRQMLLIDYSYVRMYINSIAMQAVVERAHVQASKAAFGFDFLKEENKQDHKYIEEVIEASRSVLIITVDLANADLLRYAPVRIFIRVASAAIFLLKAISLGTSLPDLEKSLEILEKCIHALRFKTADDMHLSSRYGMLLDRHVRRFRRNFRMRNGRAMTRTSGGAEQDRTTNTLPDRSSLMPASEGPDAQPNLTTDAFDLPLDLTTDMDDWLAQPFDPAFAPFGMDLDQTSSGFDMNSLDFLWNIPE